MPSKTRKNTNSGKNATTRRIRRFIQITREMASPYMANSCKKLEAAASPGEKRKNEEKKIKMLMKNPVISKISEKQEREMFKEMKKALDFSKEKLLKFKKKIDNKPCKYDKELGVYKQDIKITSANLMG